MKHKVVIMFILHYVHFKNKQCFFENEVLTVYWKATQTSNKNIMDAKLNKTKVVFCQLV